MPILNLKLDYAPINAEFALSDIVMDIEEGLCTAIVGKSGCGKSTLLKILAGFVKEYFSCLSFHGKLGSNLSPLEWTHYYQKVAFIGQNYLDALSPKMTAWDILVEPLLLSKMPIHKEEILQVLKSVGLEEEHLVRTPEQLSGGQNQRLLIARALLLHPKVLLCDEITSGLDLPQKVSIVKLLANLKKAKGIGLVFITHEALLLPFIADEVLTMSDGEIVERASVASMFSHSQSDTTKILLEASLLRN